MYRVYELEFHATFGPQRKCLHEHFQQYNSNCLLIARIKICKLAVLFGLLIFITHMYTVGLLVLRFKIAHIKGGSSWISEKHG